MIDIKAIRENPEAIKRNAEFRHVSVDVDIILTLDGEKRLLQNQIGTLNERRNTIAEIIKNDPDKRDSLLNEARDIKGSLTVLEETLKKVDSAFKLEMLKVPNFTDPTVPIGKDDSENKPFKVVGEPRKFDFEPKNHVDIATDLGIVDFEAGTKVSGSKFYFLKGDAVLMEMALIQYALGVAMKYGFIPMTTPVIAKDEILTGAGFNPRGPENQIFSLEGSNTSLIGTSEITIGGYYANAVLDVSELPVKLAGVTDCFRKETGGYGQINKGLYRVPQFKKVEMFQFVNPNESTKVLGDMLAMEEEIFQGLGLPYHVVNICSGDLGGPAYKKYDIEAWMPFINNNQGGYGEVTSTSNCTDFQARRWNIRFKENGIKQYVHTLNGTAIATTRVLLAILENYQQKDGSVEIPDVLRKYMGERTHITKK